jgi:putative spermidine/putrescine transport system substrate-binding protein
MIRTNLVGVTAGLLILGGGSAVAEEITVVSWGGALTDALKTAIYEPFTTQSGIDVLSFDWSGNFGQIVAQVEAENVTWDVVDGDSSYAVRGCDEGVLEPIAIPDLEDVQDDFLPGTELECGIPNYVFGYVIGYDARAFDTAPTAAADFFDLEAFPGRRAMPRRPDSTLEFALLGDGVPVDEVYEILATPEGVDRAFARLDTIKHAVTWWSAGAQPPQLLIDGEVAMSVSFASRLVAPIVEANAPFGIIWDGHLYDFSTWMIPKGAPNLEASKAFILAASQPEAQAEVATLTGNAPVRLSALSLVGDHPSTGVPMGPLLLTNHRENALQIDTEFWADNLESLSARFDSWLLE